MSVYPYTDIAERFARETATHEMTILHDDGLYRHVRFASADNSFYWFDLITWPGVLAFRGDGEGFMFSRERDMFPFFAASRGRINADYWAEKLVSNRDCVKRYSQEKFEQRVKEHFVEAVRYGDAPRGLGKAVREQILEAEEIGWEDGALQILRDFRFYKNPEDQYDWRKSPDFEFSDTWEWNLREYDWWYLWACHAIAWGIGQYNAAKAGIEAPAVVIPESVPAVPLIATIQIATVKATGGVL